MNQQNADVKMELEDTPEALEICLLHQRFVDWYNGVCENTDEVFVDWFEKSMTPEFCFVGPSGKVQERSHLLGQLRGAHGKFRHLAEFNIIIRNVVTRVRDGNISVATYEEWQTGVPPGTETARHSTAVLRKDPSRQYGLVWVHCHETWSHPPALQFGNA
eukprot:comp71177_c0_seq1/m.48142 comp71177_c0_seq1/g.48142  ORF comp71177_c0_seq1/g.48142 comp71177_c0_seq1/m.48142 type:complete len:160 (-) comp71177_c0_seq1:150-629(-)